RGIRPRDFFLERSFLAADNAIPSERERAQPKGSIQQAHVKLFGLSAHGERSSTSSGGDCSFMLPVDICTRRLGALIALPRVVYSRVVTQGYGVVLRNDTEE